MNDDITCPYCQHSFDDADWGDETPNETYEIECPKCEKIFLVMFELEPTFYSHETPCLNGAAHVLKPAHGAPGAYFVGRTYCKWCGKRHVDTLLNDYARQKYKEMLEKINQAK